MAISLRFHLFFFIFCLSNIIFLPNLCQSKICLPEEHTALFVFGDSLFDAGNNNYINSTTDFQANFSPYGETFFKYSTGRFSDGRLIPDFIAEYAKLPLIQPYLFAGYQRYFDGVNFASAGAGALVETHRGLVIDLKTQLSYFKKVRKELRHSLGDAETKTLLGRAVYLITIGTNDYLSTLAGNSSIITSGFPENIVSMVIGNMTAVIKEIHKEGGRKFGLLNLAPLGCVPLMKVLVNGTADSCLEVVTEMAKLHNKALSVALQKLDEQLKGFKYSFPNFYDLVSELINNPSAYDFKEGGVACCGSGPYRGYSNCGIGVAGKDYELCDNPSDYVFFDAVHPTERATQLLAKQMWSGSYSISGHYNLKLLLED